MELLAPSELCPAPSMLPPQVPAVATPTPFRWHAGSVLGLLFTTVHSQLRQPHSTVEICQRARMARTGAHLRLGLTLGFVGRWPESWAVSACFLRLVLGVSKCMRVCSLQTESRFLTVLLFVPLVFKPAKGTHLPGVRPLVWVAQYVALPAYPQGGSFNLCNPTPYLCPLPGCWSQLDRFSSLPT